MSGNIDRRVVEMRFDNKDFEKNTQDTITVLEKLKEKLAFKDAGKDFDSNGLSSSIDGVKNRFSALEIVGMTTLVNLTNSAVNLGKSLAKSLTVDQVHAGFAEYELKMGSIQTIMASTGESIDVVNKKLNELNQYSDRTIYSFSDMTQNIGKFTNAGVELEAAVQAIKGISNEAALSGANAQEASRAMYNFAQALSAGYVKLIDWKSIENANMATKGFKQQLIETAVAMGTLEKTTDGYKSTTTDLNGKVSEVFTSTKGFNESLANQWMTTEVLTQTLQNYSVDLENMSDKEKQAWRNQMKSLGYTEEQIKEVENLSKKAYAAAQDVKTFSQLMDTVKESIGSGWAQTFEILFGNLEEAKVLWTSINNVISKFVSVTSGARNTILQTWKDLGGRKDIAEGLKAAFGAVGDAFKAAFPVASKDQLEAIGQKLKDITEGFEHFGKRIGNLKPYFTDIFKAFHDVVSLVGDAFKGLFDVINGGGGEGALEAMLKCFVMMAAWISRGVSGVIAFARASGIFKVIHGVLLAVNDILFGVIENVAYLLDIFKGSFAGLSEPLKEAGDGFNKLFDSIDIKKLGVLDGASKIFETLAKGLGKLLSAIGQGASKLSLGSIGGLLAGGGIFAAATKLSGLISTITKKVEKAKNTPKLLDKVKEAFGELSESLRSFQTSVKAKALLTVASAVGVLAASCYVLSTIPLGKLAASITALGFLMGELTVASMYMKSANVKGIIKISAAIYILAKALKTLSEVEDLGKGVGAIALLMGELAGFFKVLDKIKLDPSRINSLARSMILVAISMAILAIPVKTLGNMDLKSLGKGLLGVGGALIIMAGFFALMQSKVISTTAPRINSIAKSLLVFAVAIAVLAVPIRILGSMNIANIGKGLAALSGALIVFGTFVAAMSKIDLSGKKILAVSASLMVMATAMNLMAVALAVLSSFDASGGLSTLFGTLVILGVAVKALSGSLEGAAAMIVVAGALAILAPAIALLSGLNLGGVVVGLLALAGTLAIFGAAATILAPVTVAMLALGGAMALVGAGMLAFSGGIFLLAAAFTTGLAPILIGIVEIAKTLPTIFTAIATAIGAFLTAIVEEIPKLGPVLDSLFVVLGNTIVTHIPQLVTIVLTLVIALMDTIRSKIGEFTTIAIDIIVNFVNALASRAGDISNAGLNLMVSFFNGTADAIATNGPLLIDSIKNIVLSIIEVIAGEIPIFGDKAADAIRKYREGLESGAGATKKAAKSIGKGTEEGVKISDKALTSNVKKPLESISKELESTGKTASKKAKKTADDTSANLKIKSQTSNGSNAVKGIISGMDSQIPALRSKSNQIANIVDATIRKKNEIKSPSRRLARTGKYMMEGLIAGLDSLTPEYQNRANNISTVLIRSTDAAMDAMSAFNSMNLNGAIAQSSEVNLRMTDIQRENEKLSAGINSLTKQLGNMTESMNSRALNNYINIDGSADPEEFADGLIRSFRLNARTV